MNSVEQKCSSNKRCALKAYEKVTQRFVNNGYPVRFLNAQLRKIKNNQENGNTNPKRTAPSIFLRFPYLNEQLKRRVNNLVRRTHLNDQVSVWFDSGKNLARHFHPPKESIKCAQSCPSCKTTNKPNLCSTKNVIYQISCKLCNKLYIGETCRPISYRLKEHCNKTNSTSAVAQHFVTQHENADISIEWTILHKYLPNQNQRLFLEAKYISRVDRCKLMNGCVGISINGF